MPSSSARGLLVLALLATHAAAQPAPDMPEEKPRRIELGMEQSGSPPELRISPTLSTVVLFDAPLTRVEVEEPRRFRRVRVAGDTLTLVPAGGLKDGARVKLTVYFQDGAAAGSAALMLVADAAAAEREVEVHRRPRPPEPCQQEVEGLRDENQRLHREVEQLRTAQVRPRGLSGLLADLPLKEDDLLGMRRIDAGLDERSRSSLWVRTAWTYRAGPQVALVLEVENPAGATSWRAGLATLENPAGAASKVLSVWPEAPIPPRERGRIVMEAEASSEETRGTFTLTLQDVGGGPALILGNITFP
jgi:uncharacterized protein (TIGR02268 family)